LSGCKELRTMALSKLHFDLPLIDDKYRNNRELVKV